MADPNNLFLVQGDDEVKIDGWRKRVHDRAAAEPESTLELFPDQTPADEVALAMSAMTLAIGRRWMLVEGVERWKEKDVKVVTEALNGIPPDTMVVLVASGPFRREKGTEKPPTPAKLLAAVQKSGGEVQNFKAPTASQYAKWTIEQASKVGLAMSTEAAQALADRVGQDEKRRLQERQVMRELEKIAIYAPDDGRVDVDTVEKLTASDAEARTYELADAVVVGDNELAVSLAEDLRDRGADIMYVLFALLRKVRDTRRAWAVLEEGGSTRQIAVALGIPEWKARPIKAQAERADGVRLERLSAALADLDYAVRGGANVDAGTELTLMIAGVERAGAA
ncbi:MAG: polymerase subunit delta [Acidobacteriota bacterium]|nr:polymerase subunit delta [Acidobacteriota bacterium]